MRDEAQLQKHRAFHLCTAQCQRVKTHGKFLAHVSLALKDPCRWLFQFFTFLWSLTLFSGLNKCTADTAVPQSWSTLITHKTFTATLLHLNFVLLEPLTDELCENRKHAFSHLFPKTRNFSGFKKNHPKEPFLFKNTWLAAQSSSRSAGGKVVKPPGFWGIWRIPTIHCSQGYLMGTQIPVLGSRAYVSQSLPS